MKENYNHITDESISLRPEVLKFAKEMERQLQANEHKGHWRNCTYSFLLEELDKNIENLKYLNENRGGNLVEIRENMRAAIIRCANIANFAMMFADNCGGLNMVDKPLLTSYIEAAMINAEMEMMSNGEYYGYLPDCQGVWASESTPSDCYNTLRSVLEEWIILKLSDGDTLPTINGTTIGIFKEEDV